MSRYQNEQQKIYTCTKQADRRAIILDENFPESQKQLFKAWRIPVRQIGVEISRKGIQDDEIIPLLVRLRFPSFFTLDNDFYSRHLCHEGYGIICVDVAQLGIFARLSHAGISLWRFHAENEVLSDWEYPFEQKAWH